MSFAIRSPSVAWESIVVPDVPNGVLWAWFKPLNGPLDVMVQIPPETYASCGTQLTMRRVLQSVGVSAEEAESWTVHGATYPTQNGSSPLLDQPLPPPGNQGLSIRMLPTFPPPVGTVQAAGQIDDDRLLDAFDADWHALLQLETQLGSARKQLGAIQGQLQSLNRDLSPDERLAADNQDKQDWQDARRWLRDSLALVSRWIRDHDIGMVSAAGNRNRFEQVYQQHVSVRQSIPGLPAVHHEFEQHRKTAQHLLTQMQSAHQKANTDGVMRARQVLGRISAKVRRSNEKRGTRSKKGP